MGTKEPVMHDIKNELKRACESILPALIETTTEMIARFDPEFQIKIKNNIVLAGGGSLIRGLRKYLITKSRCVVKVLRHICQPNILLNVFSG